jgi:hypothetical protein
MNDTPETEASIIASGGDWSPVLRETCRRLERERDEAIRKLENLKADAIHSCHNECQRPICVLRRERDAAIEKHRFAVIHWQIGVAKMERERDEAREEHRKLKIILDLIKKETL